MNVEDRVVVTGPGHSKYGSAGRITGLAPASKKVWIKFDGTNSEVLIDERDLTVRDE